MRGLQEIRVLRLMTGTADFDLGRRGLYRVLRGVHSVAACAGHIARGVSTRCPVMRRIRLVASQALRVLFDGGRGGLGAEVDHTRQRAASRLHMCAPRPMAGLALQAAVSKGTAGIIWTGMLGVEDARDAGIVVTGQATIGSLRAVR